jgi:hypothetical protein
MFKNNDLNEKSGAARSASRNNRPNAGIFERPLEEQR